MRPKYTFILANLVILSFIVGCGSDDEDGTDASASVELDMARN